MIRHRHSIELAAAAVVLLGLAFLAACADAQPIERSQPEPPAAAEVRDLRAEELAAQRAAAKAAAAGDTAAAAYQTRLAEEVGKIRAAAEQRERSQAADLARMQEDADARAQKHAEAQQLAADIRRARIVAGLGLALCAVAAALGAWSGLGRLALPIAGAAAIGCATLAAYAESMRSAWFLPVVLGGLAIAVVAWVRIARGDRALIDTAKLADAGEDAAHRLADRLKEFGVLIDDRAHALAEKSAAWASQRAAGVASRVAKARGKTVKNTPPT